MNAVYMLVGCPGSGKTWVINQLKEKFHCLPHDDYIDKDYVKATLDALKSASKRVLIETPFSMSQIVDPLNERGIAVIPVYIQEDHGIIADRYMARDGKQIPKGHLTRQKTYLSRAEENGDFHGTTEQVLEYLRKL